MAKLIYSTITSLDGYVADKDGNFDRAEPDERCTAGRTSAEPCPIAEGAARSARRSSRWRSSDSVSARSRSGSRSGRTRLPADAAGGRDDAEAREADHRRAPSALTGRSGRAGDGKEQIDLVAVAVELDARPRLVRTGCFHQRRERWADPLVHLRENACSQRAEVGVIADQT